MKKFLGWVKRLFGKPDFIKFEFVGGQWVESKHGMVCLRTTGNTAVSFDCGVFDLTDGIEYIGFKESILYHSIIDEPSRKDILALMREIQKEGILSVTIEYMYDNTFVSLEVPGDNILTLLDTYDEYELIKLEKI